MPSAAKKRKAVKKKKEQQALNSNNNNNNSSSISETHPRGNDEPKSQDERESDGNEVDSLASQDNLNRDHSVNGENEKYDIRPASQDNQNQLYEESEKTVQSGFVTEDKPVDGVAWNAEGSQKTEVEDQSIVKIEREVNFEQDIRSEDVDVEHVESAKESHEGGDESSSSSSSEDESRASDKKWEPESHHSAVDTITFTYNDVDYVEATEDSRTDQPLTKANGNSVTETAVTIDSATPMVSMSEVGKRVMEGAQCQNPEVFDVVEPGLQPNAGLIPEENANKAFPVSDEKVEASTAIDTSNLNANGVEVLKSSSAQTASEENVKDSETLKTTVGENKGKTLASSGVHTSEAHKDVDKAKDFEASEHIETQPLVPQAPQIARRTLWMSCCGILDVFTGSDR